jgi:HEPN domain-containing protein
MKNLKQEAQRWLRQAQLDFAFLEVARQVGKYDTCCFLAQQTAEKALKGYLFYQGEELIFTHAIFRLCTMAAQYDPAFEDIREQVKLLDFHYVEARYPNALEGAIPAEFYSDQDARQAIAMARIVIEAVQVRIGAEPAP